MAEGVQGPLSDALVLRLGVPGEGLVEGVYPFFQVADLGGGGSCLVEGWVDRQARSGHGPFAGQGAQEWTGIDELPIDPEIDREVQGAPVRDREESLQALPFDGNRGERIGRRFRAQVTSRSTSTPPGLDLLPEPTQVCDRQDLRQAPGDRGSEEEEAAEAARP